MRLRQSHCARLRPSEYASAGRGTGLLHREWPDGLHRALPAQSRLLLPVRVQTLSVWFCEAGQRADPEWVVWLFVSRPTSELSGKPLLARNALGSSDSVVSPRREPGNRSRLNVFGRVAARPRIWAASRPKSISGYPHPGFATGARTEVAALRLVFGEADYSQKRNMCARQLLTSKISESVHCGQSNRSSGFRSFRSLTSPVNAILIPHRLHSPK